MTSPFQTAVSAVRERKKFTSQREAEGIVTAVIGAIREPSGQSVESIRLAYQLARGSWRGANPPPQWDDLTPEARLMYEMFAEAIGAVRVDSLLGSGG